MSTPLIIPVSGSGSNFSLDFVTALNKKENSTVTPLRIPVDSDLNNGLITSLDIVTYSNTKEVATETGFTSLDIVTFRNKKEHSTEFTLHEVIGSDSNEVGDISTNRVTIHNTKDYNNPPELWNLISECIIPSGAIKSSSWKQYEMCHYNALEEIIDKLDSLEMNIDMDYTSDYSESSEEFEEDISRDICLVPHWFYDSDWRSYEDCENHILFNITSEINRLGNVLNKLRKQNNDSELTDLDTVELNGIRNNNLKGRMFTNLMVNGTCSIPKWGYSSDWKEYKTCQNKLLKNMISTINALAKRV